MLASCDLQAATERDSPLKGYQRVVEDIYRYIGDPDVRPWHLALLIRRLRRTPATAEQPPSLKG